MTRAIRLPLCLALFAMIGTVSARAQQGGVAPLVLLDTHFDAPSALEGWSIAGESVRLEPAAAGHAGFLHIERTEAQGPGSTFASLALPIENLRGARLVVEARLRAQNVATPPQSYNGIKVMLHLAGPDTQWPQATLPVGSFDWRQTRFVTPVPDDATAATLVLGLEATTGGVDLDQIRIVLLPPREGPLVAIDPATLDRRLAVPRLRGVMSGHRLQEADLLELGQQWKANHVRWQLIWGGFPNGPADTATPEEYRVWLEGELDRLESLLPICQKAGLLVLIDLHTPPGGRVKQDSVHRMFQEKRFQDEFLAVWEVIASRFRDQPAVWGYDLLNEPVEGALPPGLLPWQEVAQQAAQRVRSIDPRHAIIVEPAPWGGPESLADFAPIEGVDGVVYSVHIYLPHSFTHQGVYDNRKGIVYPGVIEGRPWDKETLRQAIEPVLAFQNDHRVPIYIGEFSAIRWAPGTSAHDYLRDVISLMEEYGWDWAYHAFREWDGWSVEHGNDPDDHTPATTMTDRERLLRSHFEKNARPPG